MCGMVGTLNLTRQHAIEERTLRRMLATIRHRGPDQFGIYRDGQVGLGSARLSIIDLSTGQQPIGNEDGTLWIVFNGEVYNYVELRPELEARGHRFQTHTDTEVILHLYEDCGPACLSQLNGQFALAIWDTRTRALFLARDRVGVRPLFYTVTEGALTFGSEVKAILADPRVQARIDPVALAQVFTFWSPQPPRTAFQDVLQLPPGHYLLARDGHITVQPYWQLEFPEVPPDGAPPPPLARSQVEARVEEFRELLIDATRIRLRADVPVGAYLSGGLDSSATAAIVRNYTPRRLDTFSIAFDDPLFDESAFQRRMAAHLGTDHQVVRVGYEDIGRVFPEVVWHAEAPMTRTAPAPMLLLARLVRQHHTKVVLTGEGADEFLAGYDIFKEAKIRRFWARHPESRARPLLLRRLYADVAGLAAGPGGILAAFFGQGLTDTDAWAYSHALRWRNTNRARRFFSSELRAQFAQGHGGDPCDWAQLGVQVPPQFGQWHPLAQAQYLEVTTFLSPYLLSTQGDRMGMAASVEGRFPFLDHRVIDYANRTPPQFKLRGLTEKYLLRRAASPWLPGEICQRPKRAYRAPIHRSFFAPGGPEYVRELLSPRQLRDAGLFDAVALDHMVEKIDRGAGLGETDDMALVGALSTQLLYQQFVRDFRMPAPLGEADDVKVCVGPG
ncbi:MAG: asparagine synthase (glutamine-hydrolyzing) [Candidatus Latescibacterota bacterium]